MRRQTILLLLSLGLAILLARSDRDVASLVDMARWENVPALAAYTLLFRSLLAGVFLVRRASVKRHGSG